MKERVEEERQAGGKREAELGARLRGAEADLAKLRAAAAASSPGEDSEGSDGPRPAPLHIHKSPSSAEHPGIPASARSIASQPDAVGTSRAPWAPRVLAGRAMV